MPSVPAEIANVLLTTDDAVIGATPREVVWTHRETTLYRYRSVRRQHAVPVLLVFALINRPEIFDLRPGGSLVEYMLDEGFDVFLVDWGVPAEADADMGLEDYVLDELHWAIREALRASRAEELTLMGWCMGATLCAMYCGLDRSTDAAPRDSGHPDAGAGPTPTCIRNLVLLTTPFDGRPSTYAAWVRDLDSERIAEQWRVVPGSAVDFANKLLKPVPNFFTSYRRLAQGVADRTLRRDAHQSMAKWVADNPPFPGRALSDWLRWLYQDDALIGGRVRLRGRRVDLRRVDQNLLVVTARADHIAPPEGTTPVFDLVASEDVTHFDRPGGHIGLIAGSAARRELWPDIAEWLTERSER
jgi:polyhydroxyalkanoate synthase